MRGRLSAPRRWRGPAAGAGGLWCVPALYGLGTPEWTGTAAADISGLTASSTAADISEAALIGVAHQVSDAIDAVRAGLPGPDDDPGGWRDERERLATPGTRRPLRLPARARQDRRGDSAGCRRAGRLGRGGLGPGVARRPARRRGRASYRHRAPAAAATGSRCAGRGGRYATAPLRAGRREAHTARANVTPDSRPADHPGRETGRMQSIGAEPGASGRLAEPHDQRGARHSGRRRRGDRRRRRAGRREPRPVRGP